jgi:hypothetical protein
MLLSIRKSRALMRQAKSVFNFYFERGLGNSAKWRTEELYSSAIDSLPGRFTGSYWWSSYRTTFSSTIGILSRCLVSRFTQRYSTRDPKILPILTALLDFISCIWLWNTWVVSTLISLSPSNINFQKVASTGEFSIDSSCSQRTGFPISMKRKTNFTVTFGSFEECSFLRSNILGIIVVLLNRLYHFAPSLRSGVPVTCDSIACNRRCGISTLEAKFYSLGLQYNSHCEWARNYIYIYIYVAAVPKIKVILRTTVSRPVCPGTRPPSGTRDQFCFHFHWKYIQTFVGFFLWGALSDERKGR